MLKNPFTVNLERQAAPGRRDHAGGLSGRPEPQGAAAARAPEARRHQERPRLHAHQAPRQPPRRDARRSSGVPCERIHGNRSPGAAHAGAGGLQGRASTASSSRPTSPRAASTSRRSRTSSTSTCRNVPEDYIHRVGRTARAEMTGDAFTFVSPEEAGRPRGDRARDRQAAAADHGPGLRLHEGARGALRGADRRADRADPRAQGRGAPAREGEGGAAHRARDGACGTRRGPEGGAPGASGARVGAPTGARARDAGSGPVRAARKVEAGRSSRGSVIGADPLGSPRRATDAARCRPTPRRAGCEPRPSSGPASYSAAP